MIEFSDSILFISPEECRPVPIWSVKAKEGHISSDLKPENHYVRKGGHNLRDPCLEFKEYISVVGSELMQRSASGPMKDVNTKTIDSSVQTR